MCAHTYTKPFFCFLFLPSRCFTDMISSYNPISNKPAPMFLLFIQRERYQRLTVNDIRGKMAFQSGFNCHFSFCEQNHLSKAFLKAICTCSPVNHIFIFFAVFHHEPLLFFSRSFLEIGVGRWAQSFVCGRNTSFCFADAAIVTMLKISVFSVF